MTVDIPATSQEDLKISPMMVQWNACKKEAKDALLLFRMGDFYEAFYEDAALLSRELELTLTKRQGIPMSGVPAHTCEVYVEKLVNKGFRVAIAEQTENPKLAKGLVKREVVRIVTPGTLMNASSIADKSNNFFVSSCQVGFFWGLAFLDLSTGEFKVSEFSSEEELFHEWYRLRPSEILISEKTFAKHPLLFQKLKQALPSILMTIQEEWRFAHPLASQTLTAHFNTHSLDGFGLKESVAGINAAGALLSYLKDSLSQTVDHIQEIQSYSSTDYMLLDAMTLRHLELLEPMKESGKQHTLLSVLDNTQTAMGGRLLKQWIKRPLLSVEEIHLRQDAIQALLSRPETIDKILFSLSQVRDLERLIMKVTTANASPRDLVALRISLEALPLLHKVIEDVKSPLWETLYLGIQPLPEMTDLLAKALEEDPPLRVGEGKIFRSGFDQQLDELRHIGQDSKAWLLAYQTELREETGIKTLKVSYTRLFGYYIEVSRGQAEKMPPSFHRKQTLVNAERYITQELKDYEHKALTAEEKTLHLETELFIQLRNRVAQEGSKILQIARHLAVLDVLACLTKVAKEKNYCRPLVDNSRELMIREGRHPVIEAVQPMEPFISNDIRLDAEKERMLIITGPNMAGKSTYIRQVALIAILAQMGAYVPAREAHIGILDKIFTRIGASDDLSRGQSTFMVEMTETANILHHATDRSLVILDEIGRGTSTYDGISIAWAVAEYLLTTEGKKAKTLFATHYWELTQLETQYFGVVNYSVAVQEIEEKIVFLRKILRGGTDKSYGIHVAQLAGMPSWVVFRAKEILTHLEENNDKKNAFKPVRAKKPSPSKQQPSASLDLQLYLFSKDVS